MRYTVVWKPHAEERLADIWLNAPNRAAVTAAANHIDQQLAEDTHQVGESRTGLTRVVIALPLVVYFDVRQADRMVDVLTVRYVPRRPRAN